ncbi:MAG: hypothetical protein H7Y18_05020 [Clostridiaceae bacterium]|nr:hypothetical protein [Clostridiaceae bacterium]
MNSIYTPLIHEIRRFNRFYTNILGLLDQHMLSSKFSLSEKPLFTGEKVTIRSELKPGGAGYLIHLHGWIYAKECGYNQVFLETTEDQKTAIKMYTKAGFKKVAEHGNKAWGKDLIEQTFELNLPQ